MVNAVSARAARPTTLTPAAPTALLFGQGPPRPLLDALLPRQVRAELLPEIVVLAHAVVEPQHVIGMLDRITGKPQADHPIDRPLLVSKLDVRAPRREIRAALLPEPVLRCDDEAGVVALFLQRADELTSHHQMPAFRKRRARGNDADRRH